MFEVNNKKISLEGITTSYEDKGFLSLWSPSEGTRSLPLFLS